MYKNGAFKKVSLNNDTTYSKFGGYATQLLFDKSNHVYISKGFSAPIEKREEIFHLNTNHLDPNDFSISKHSVFDLGETVWKDKEEKTSLIKIADQYFVFDKEDHLSINVAIVDSLSLEWFAFFHNNRTKRFTNGEANVFEIDSGAQVRNFSLDVENNLWLCTSKGLFLYPNRNLDLPPRHFFKGLDVTSITMDREGSYWMASREKGIFWIPSFRFSSLLRSSHSLEVQRVSSIGKLTNFLLLGTVENGIYAINKQLNLEPKLKELTEVIETRRMYSENNTIYTEKFGRIKEVAGSLKTYFIDEPLINNYFVKRLKNGSFISTGAIGYNVYDDDFIKKLYSSTYDERVMAFKNKLKKTTPFNFRIYCINEKDDFIWLGTIDGLYRIPSKDLASGTLQKDTSEYTNVRIEDIILTDSQGLWIATIGKGLVFKNGDHYQQWLDDRLSSNLINRICLENDSTLWVGSNKGLDRVRFQYEGKGVKVNSIFSFSTSDGLISNFINDLAVWENQLWLATNRGVNYFRTDEMIENEVPPLIHIEGVLVGDHYVDSQEYGQLKHDEDDLVFTFLGVSFKKPKNKIFYRYRLKNDEDIAYWYYTDNRSIRFLDLAPGDYTFEVKAQNKNGYWSKQDAQYSFTIHAHFTDQIWFRVLASLLLVLLVAIGFYYRVRTIKNQEEQKRETTECGASCITQSNESAFYIQFPEFDSEFYFSSGCQKSKLLSF